MPADLALLLASLSADQIREHLFRCCGSTRWVDSMLAHSPFADEAQLREKARALWSGLAESDYLEAFSHHPRIGSDPEALRQKFGRTASWSAGEQSSVQSATEETIMELSRYNTEYIQKFGFVFLICATGKSAAEMLVALKKRLPNDRATEIQNAATEQAHITQIRLDKLKAELNTERT
ncbi:MAG: 2-oxo-4-hydroxy-4-carboxy-5-ureidoimidazoline decarboxylase [Spirochaetales bacterium]|nr:2-oxo-4-hydroxy-4-carboxy-5-ureidoimidazoline decarboxylase [Spirochaetales bacterium]